MNFVRKVSILLSLSGGQKLPSNRETRKVHRGRFIRTPCREMHPLYISPYQENPEGSPKERELKWRCKGVIQRL